MIRIQWDLKIISDNARFRITRRKLHWFWSIWPENSFGLCDNSDYAEFTLVCWNDIESRHQESSRVIIADVTDDKYRRLLSPHCPPLPNISGGNLSISRFRLGITVSKLSRFFLLTVIYLRTVRFQDWSFQNQFSQRACEQISHFMKHWCLKFQRSMNRIG